MTGEQSFDTFEYILDNATVIDTGFAVSLIPKALAINNYLRFIVLEHDLYQQTVDMAVGYTLPSALNFTPHLTVR